ncbi:multiprotein-bridging factor 1 family protein [Prauserella oleivorans]|uniref:Multiprotein-bridging factor 1 family protein n=1 Tax=Prauserella oleivorans TaxID=1478153 RepID=A0ABW5WDJ2_9PSEU
MSRRPLTYSYIEHLRWYTLDRRQELAARREAMGFTQESLAQKLGVEASTVGRWERGTLTPQPWRRPRIASELKLSLAELDALLNPSTSGAAPADATISRRDVMRDTALLTGTVLAHRWLPAGTVAEASSDGAALQGLPSTTAAVTRLHETYQAARYAEVAGALSTVADAITALMSTSQGQERRQALILRCSAAVVEAKLATKTGDGAAARVAAERAKAAADDADDPFGQAAAAYQMTCALLKLDQAAVAEELAVGAAASMTGDDPRRISWAGALTLIAAIIAARRNDLATARGRLDTAQRLADRLGRDTNIGYTAFGPTNVTIHRMSAAVALDDPYQLLATSERLDLMRMPTGLRGRRAQFHLDSAWAHTQIDEDALAVLHLLETDRIAPEIVYTSRTAHNLIRDLMARERRRDVPGLRELAIRTGVAA